MSHKKPAGDACLTCPGFHKPCVRPEPAEGKTRLAVVGETPTYSEVHEGQPFGGNSGRLLGRLLRKHGNLSRNQVHWTNAVLCDVDKDDQKEARKHCQQRLLDELAAAGHPTTLALGAIGLQSAVGGISTPIMKWRGFVIEPRDPVRGPNSGRHTVIGSVHPGFVQRSEAWMPIFEADVARACRVARSGFTRPEDSARTVIGTNIDLVRETLSRLDTNVVVDIETTGLDIHTVSITCLVIADTKTALVIPISKTLFGDGFYFGHQHQEVIDAINEALEDRVAVTHNGPAFDHIGLARYGIKIKQWDDSLNAYHVITSHFPKSLGHVVACYLDAPPWKQWKHNGSLEQLWAYCGRDGLYNAQAWHSLRASMTEDDMVVYEHDKRNAIMCQRMSQNGFLFDQERAAELSQHMVNEEARLQDQAGEILGRQINLLSPKQLQDAFFRQLRAPITFVSDKGQPSLGEEALLGYAASANDKLRELATLVLRYRSVRMCRAKNITNIKPHEDGRVRPSWYSYGTISGRWASGDPNLSNLPKGNKDPSLQWGGIRSLYIVQAGRKLVGFDIAQAEFRVAAHLTGDPNMLEACKPGRDVHRENAARIFERFGGADKDRQTKLRDMAKTANFAVCYLAGPGTVHARFVANGEKITFAQTEAFLNRLKKAFAVYYEYQNKALFDTMRTGIVRSPIIGRVRWLGYNPDPAKVANFPIQSGAADCMNIKLWKIFQEIDRRGLDAKLVAMVYDAAYFDTAEKDVAAVSELCQSVFDEPITIGGLPCVLPIDLKAKNRWSEL